MPQESRQSVKGKVFASSGEAREHGKGGIWYRWKPDSNREFPADVESVMIVMPVDWGEPGITERGIPCEWTVSAPNSNGARWTLSGTEDSPTLSPSLHWVGMWHGFLSNGDLNSC